MRGPENSFGKRSFANETSPSRCHHRTRIQVRSALALEATTSGFIRLTQFNEQTTENPKRRSPAPPQAGDKQRASSSMRNNQAVLDQAVSVSMFLDRGRSSTRGRTAENPAVQSRGATSPEQASHRAADRWWPRPRNCGRRSASRRATVIGTLVRQRLGADAIAARLWQWALRLTTARYSPRPTLDPGEGYLARHGAAGRYPEGSKHAPTR